MKQANGKPFKILTEVVNAYEPIERPFYLKFIVKVNC